MKIIKFIFMNMLCIIGVVAINLDISDISANYEWWLNTFGTALLFISIPSGNKFIEDALKIKKGR